MRDDLLVLSLVLNAALLIALFVHVSGVSFGDRCAVHYGTSTPEWQQCVNDLREGRNMKFPRRGATE